jgi:predicted dinucleotide-binding enzyme
MLSSRNPQSETMQNLIAEIGANAQAGTVAETVAFGDVVAVAIGWQNGLESVLTSVPDWSGKVLIDTTNRFEGGERSAGEDIARLTGAPVIKAFNTIGAEHLLNPVFGDTTLTMVICGDDAAKDKAQSLVSDIGFEVIDLGGLEQCHLVEALAAVWVGLAFRQGYGRNVAVQIIRK